MHSPFLNTAVYDFEYDFGNVPMQVLLDRNLQIFFLLTVRVLVCVRTRKDPKYFKVPQVLKYFFFVDDVRLDKFSSVLQ